MIFFGIVFVLYFLKLSGTSGFVPLHKKEIKSDQANYRPVSILCNLSKIYEKLMY